MVSKQNGKTDFEPKCKWRNCSKAKQVYETPEDLLDHVLSEHIPKLIKNGTDEEVVCEWADCETSTNRGDLSKKTDWMKNHFKTRHAKSAKTFKCMFKDCTVLKGTSQELETHVRLVHLAKPKRLPKPAPETAEPKKAPNRIWKIINGEVVYDDPIIVTKKTIIEYDDGPRYVYPTGCPRCNYDSDESELASDEEWALMEYEDDDYEAPSTPPMCGYGIVIERREKPDTRPKRPRRYKRKIVKVEEVKQVEKVQEKKTSEESKLAAKTAEELLFDEILEKKEIDDVIAFEIPPEEPSKKKLKRKTSPVKSENPAIKLRKTKKSKTEKRPSRACKQLYSLCEIDDDIEAFEIIFDNEKVSEKTGKPYVKRQVHIERESLVPEKAVPPKSVQKRTPRKKATRRPSRACRVLGSMEEVPFDMEIGVEF